MTQEDKFIFIRYEQINDIKQTHAQIYNYVCESFHIEKKSYV